MQELRDLKEFTRRWSMQGALSPLVRAFWTPVSGETRRLLQGAWARLPDSLRTENQFLGRQYAGCGATIGAMPRCDFACRGCYLGREANRVPAQSMEELRNQLRQIRTWLGQGGNLQLTDGEVTLRSESELVELARYAREIGLVPMLMTHGDTFRRKPDLLQRLMRHGGLREVSIHIDTTQRGRRGAAYHHATTEEALMPLRDEFAEMIRKARQETGRPLEAATTFTVTRANIAGVPAVIHWMLRNADAFKMISFQPVAQVGRTEAELGGSVTVEELWERIAEGLNGEEAAVEDLLANRGWLGHPACSLFLQGVVVPKPGQISAFHPILRSSDPLDREVIQGFLDRFGGVTFRLDTRMEALGRLAGLVRADPTFFFKVIRFLLQWLRRLDPERPYKLLWAWLRGRNNVSYLNIISHHFMSRGEIETPLGRERLSLCALRVPIGDKMMPMCEVNAMGVRTRYYAATGDRSSTGS